MFVQERALMNEMDVNREDKAKGLASLKSHTVFTLGCFQSEGASYTSAVL